MGPNLQREGIPRISVTSEHVAGFGSVPFSELRRLVTKKVNKEKRIAVKPKFLEMYVGQPKMSYVAVWSTFN